MPRHLRTAYEVALIEPRLRPHVVDLKPDPSKIVRIAGAGQHRAKFAPGLSSLLVEMAGGGTVGDPMAGTGMLSWETGAAAKLNDIDAQMSPFLEPLRERGCETSYVPAHEIEWECDVCVFSPPYYPKTDRTRPCAHDDDKRGPVVGFRDSYGCDHPEFIGNPGGVNAILTYRQQMTRVYAHLLNVCDRMIVVTKNWTRLGVELRLDLDTILMAYEVGWTCVARHGWTPPPSLWARYNTQRGGGVRIEDVLVFERAGTAQLAIGSVA